jgi:hypothetical protein
VFTMEWNRCSLSAESALARAYNDLALLASCPALARGDPPPPLPHPDADISPGPWRIHYDPSRRRLQVLDREGKRMAERVFPRTVADARITAILKSLAGGLRSLGACASGFPAA